MNNAKILIAGAGHGGLAAAALLAKQGHDVTVLEAQTEDALGHDWTDCIRPSGFDRAGLRRPPSEQLTPMQAISYLNPRQTVCISTEARQTPVSFVIERKDMLRHLVALARANGAKLCFSHRVTGAVVQGSRVVGLHTEQGDLLCDLVVDSAGMHSSVRKSLPPECGIVRDIDKKDTLYTYRAFFNDTGKASSLPPYCAYFFHNGNKGFDWVIREKGYVDVLIGSFGSITPEIVSSAVEDFRRTHPNVGDEVLRGGTYAAIPLRRTLPQFVCDGYAAIGDCASMIEPLSGSGMTWSVESAALLAEAIDEADDCTTSSLWRYEYAFFREHLHQILHQSMLKDAMMGMGEKNIDRLFERKIVNVKTFAGGKETAAEQLQKVMGVLRTPSLLPVFGQMLRRTTAEKKLKEKLPEQYDPILVAQWKKAYAQF